MAKSLTGVVTSSLADKTIVVTVTSRETHPIYGKQYTVNRTYAAHDPKNDANKGDKVTIVECRPVSKTKSFVLEKIVERSKGSIDGPARAGSTAPSSEISAACAPPPSVPTTVQ